MPGVMGSAGAVVSGCTREGAARGGGWCQEREDATVAIQARWRRVSTARGW